MFMKNLLILCTVCFSGQLVFAQENNDSTRIQTNTNITIIEDQRIDELNKAYTATYELKGFRVQIYSGNKKQPANKYDQNS